MSDRRQNLIVLLVLTLSAFALSWPLVLNLGRAIPQGTQRSATVPLLNVWTIWWNADRAANGYQGYWDATIFHPTPDTFAMSETQPLSIVVAPILWATGSRILSYNAYLILILVLNGWSAVALCRHLRMDGLVALAAGVIVQALPYVYWRIGIVQLVPVFGILWSIHAGSRFARQPSWRNAALFGVAFATTYHLCNYYGLFLSVLAPTGLILIRRESWQWTTAAQLLFAVAVAAALIAPIAWVQWRAARQHDWQRAERTIAFLSASAVDHLTTPAEAYRRTLPHLAGPRPSRPLSPGYLFQAMAIVGLLVGWRNPSQRRWTIFCVLLLVASLVLSFGPPFGWKVIRPYQWLIDYCPGFAYIRSPFRFAVFTQLATVLLALISIERTVCFVERFRHRVIRPAMLIAITLALVLSSRGQPMRLYFVASATEQATWISWLRDRTKEESAIVVVPFVSGRNAVAFQETALSMYWSTFHHRRLASGYTGYFPKSFFTLQAAMKTFPDDASMEMLRHRGVDYAVVNDTAVDQSPRDKRPVFRDDRAGVSIYRISD